MSDVLRVFVVPVLLVYVQDCDALREEDEHLGVVDVLVLGENVRHLEFQLH